jgi:hypothetical protein
MAGSSTIDHRDWMKELKSCTAKLKRSRVKRQDVEVETILPREITLPTLRSMTGSDCSRK